MVKYYIRWKDEDTGQLSLTGPYETWGEADFYRAMIGGMIAAQYPDTNYVVQQIVKVTYGD